MKSYFILFAQVFAIPRNVTIQRRQNSCMSWTEDFSNGASERFISDGQVSISENNMQMKISLGDTPNPTTGIIMGYGAKVSSKDKILYGTVTARMKSARIGGVVSAFVVLSPEKDEIDWEWVGKNEFSSQTNYYAKGVLDYTKGQYLNNEFNTHEDYHDYSIHWTPESITWGIDGSSVRTVLKSEAGQAFPDTAANIYFSLWDGGANAAGTREWAGGQIDWSDPEYLEKGFISADIASVSYTC